MDEGVIMSTRPWWDTITTKELVALRRRLLHVLRVDYPGRNESDLEDAVQAAFLGMLVNRENVSAEHDGLFRYLGTAVRRRMIDRWRHTKVRENLKKPLTEAAEDRDPHDALVHAEKIEEIKKYVRQLRPLSRYVLRKHVVSGVSIRALARELGRDRHTIARLLHAAIVHVRRLMDRER